MVKCGFSSSLLNTEYFINLYVILVQWPCGSHCSNLSKYAAKASRALKTLMAFVVLFVCFQSLQLESMNCIGH